MYFGGTSEFWKRHPRLSLVFSLLWGAAFTTIIVRICERGSFNIGRGRDAEIVSRTDDPITFWIVIAVCATMGVLFPALAVREYVVDRPNYNADE